MSCGKYALLCPVALNCLSSHDWMCSLRVAQGGGWKACQCLWRASKHERTAGAPDGVAVGPDHHRATHGAVVCQLRLADDVQVPPAGRKRESRLSPHPVRLLLTGPNAAFTAQHTSARVLCPQAPHLEKSTDLGVTATSTALPPPPLPPLPGLEPPPWAGDGTASTLPAALHHRVLPLLLLAQPGTWGDCQCPWAWPTNTWAGLTAAPPLCWHSMRGAHPVSNGDMTSGRRCGAALRGACPETHRRSALRAAMHGAAMRGVSTSPAGIWCGVRRPPSGRGHSLILADDVAAAVAVVEPVLVVWTRSSRASTRRRLRVCVAGWRCVNEAECAPRGRPGVTGTFSNGCPLRLPALQASKTPTSPFIAPGQQAQVCAPPPTQQREQQRGGAKRQCPLARLRTAHTTRPSSAAPDPKLPLRCLPAACRLRLRGRRRHTRCVHSPGVRLERWAFATARSHCLLLPPRYRAFRCGAPLQAPETGQCCRR